MNDARGVVILNIARLLAAFTYLGHLPGDTFLATTDRDA